MAKTTQTNQSKNLAQMNPKLDTTTSEFDYCEWLKTEPTKEEFFAVWRQFNAVEKAAVLADFQQWLAANS